MAASFLNRPHAIDVARSPILFSVPSIQTSRRQKFSHSNVPSAGIAWNERPTIDKQGNELSSPWFCPLRAGVSMRKISEYQDHAAECRKIAARTRDLTRKEQLEEIAGAWQMLAEARLKQLERKLRPGSWLWLTR